MLFSSVFTNTKEMHIMHPLLSPYSQLLHCGYTTENAFEIAMEYKHSRFQSTKEWYEWNKADGGYDLWSISISPDGFYEAYAFIKDRSTILSDLRGYKPRYTKDISM